MKKNKIIEALENGQVIMFNSNEPRYYKMWDGAIYYSDKNEDATQWKKSSAKLSVFENEVQWRIL